MDARIEIKSFLAMVEDAMRDPAVREANHFQELPQPLRDALARAIRGVVDARYRRSELREAVNLIPSERRYPGALGQAVLGLIRVLADNDAYELPKRP